MFSITIMVSPVLANHEDMGNHPTPYTEPLTEKIYSFNTDYVRYNVPYTTLPNTVSSMKVLSESASIVININENSNDIPFEIDISFPLLENSHEDSFFVFADGEEIDREQYLTQRYTHLEFLIPPNTRQIEMSIPFVLGLGPSPSFLIVHDPPYSYILPPLKQLESVSDVHQIICKNDQQLTFKKNTWFPACVKSESILKLQERGWADMHDPAHMDMKMTDNDDDNNTNANSQPSIPPITVTADNTIDANNQFAFNFYSQISQDEKTKDQNIFFSPISIFTAFAIAYEGAVQNTATQMLQTFGFESDDKTRHAEIADMISGLDHKDDWYKLNVANALWIKENYTIKQDYLDTTKNNYSSTIENVNFVTDDGINTINNWIKEKTNDKIKDILAPGSTDELTRMVITNAVYFNGKWASEFNPGNTEEKKFWIDNGDSSVMVPMMHQPVYMYNYVKTDSLQALELMYLGGDIFMIILLPDEIDGINSLEESLDAKKLESILDTMTRQPITVQIPKFEFDTEYGLIPLLQNMGVHDAFDKRTADFANITDEQNT